MVWIGSIITGGNVEEDRKSNFFEYPILNLKFSWKQVSPKCNGISIVTTKWKIGILKGDAEVKKWFNQIPIHCCTNIWNNSNRLWHAISI